MPKKIILLFLSVCLGFNMQFCLASDDANTIGNKGIKLIQEGKWNEGLDLIRQAIQADPQRPDWHMNYGSLLFTKGQKIFQAGDMQEAKVLFKEAEKELLLTTQLFKEIDNKLKSHCFFLVGDIYYHVYGEKDKAKSFYQKSLELYPEHEEARGALRKIVDDSFAETMAGLSTERGVELAKKGMYDEAIAEFTRIINAEPGNADAYVNRGLAHRMKGEIDQAIADYDKAIEISPNSPHLYNVRAVAHFLKQDYNKSWDDVHRCQELGGYVDPKLIEELKKYSGREN